MECIFEYPFVRMPSLCPWIAACKYYALQRKTQTERQTRETVGWRAFTRGKCIFPRSDAFTAASGVGAGVAAAREPGGAGSFRASSTPSAGEPQSPRRPERYAFDLCEELDVESLGCTMYTRVNDLVSIRLIAMAWRYLSKSMFGSSGGESEEEDLQAAAIIASMGRKRRWGGSVFGHKIYKRDRAAAERLLMLKYFDEESIFDDDQFRRRYWVAFGFCIDII